ncbi:hypothetical protein [Glycomyces buryatensis]|uniref:Uncharacterized protein n=1 Tax=Glycomyces buryatensis TaxID=2570927 RepID=A0A4S8PVS7_9ACTN|nr:hypothetical protein [Glycomyces buryatensis]THV35693.1 hypothetical protein FAB82_22725 [Glycomyces buryatensis]
MGELTPTSAADLEQAWRSLLDLGASAIDTSFTLVFAAVGVLLLAVIAPGEQGPIQRHINRIKLGRLVNRVSVSILAVFSGIGAELYYSPRLLDAPKAAGGGVVVGLAAIVGGLAILTKNRKKRPRRALLTISAIVTTVLVGGCAIGNAVGEVAG